MKKTTKIHLTIISILVISISYICFSKKEEYKSEQRLVDADKTYQREVSKLLPHGLQSQLNFAMINVDSIRSFYNSIPSDSVNLKTSTANTIADFVKEVLVSKKQFNDSIQKIEENKFLKKKAQEEKEQKIALAKWYNTKAGRIQKRHPSWSDEVCQDIADRKIWLLMSIDMVVEERGLPNHKNISNYGYGNEYQYCWDDYNISCFYCKSDQIVYSYN